MPRIADAVEPVETTGTPISSMAQLLNSNLARQGAKGRRRIAAAVEPSWSGEELPMEGRATFLPFRDTMPGSVMNKRELALPGVVAGAVNAITAPARSMETYVDDYGNVQYKFNAPQEAANVALNMMGGGMGASRGAPANALGMFIGPRSKSWNAEANARAVQMEKAGATPEAIWQETGNWKAPDSAWRQEVSDKGSKITEDVYRGISENQKFKGLLGQGLSHDELYVAYPELKGIHSNFFAAAEPSGNFIPNARTMTVAGPDTIKQRSTALHELQHAIQQKEGFARGGSPESMTMTLEEIAQEKRQKAKELFNLSTANDPLDPSRIVKPGARKKGLQLEREAHDLDSKAVIANLSGQARFDLYRRLAGEAEARATQKRRNLTDEQRRAEFPERSYDVPISELIVRR